MRFIVLAFLAGIVRSQVTVHYIPGQEPFATTTADPSVYTGLNAYNPILLNPPPPPDPAPATAFFIQLVNGGTPGASIPQPGQFFGFSIEMSVANQVLGKNSSLIQVPFLNLMANIQERSGGVRIRVGGNTQETAKMVPELSDGRILEKDLSQVTNPTQTPPLVFTPDLLYMMANISSLVNVHWFIGIPFFNTTPFDLSIAVTGQEILGEALLGIQAANEPDFYAPHGHRNLSYNQYDYFGEFSDLIAAMGGSENDINRHLLIGPNTADQWSQQDVWNTGFVDAYSDNLAYLAFERYPQDNCAATYDEGSAVDPQQMFPFYLDHSSSVNLVANYLNSTAYAQSKGKELIMFETNTASCGGFPGISDSFGAALWGLDYALQLAYANFSGVLMHTGGQTVYYNPFTAPPTNESTYHQWTVGPIYYSALIMAESLGSSNTSQVLDISANGGNIYTPGYVIYEQGTPVRLALFNFITDSSGAHDYYATFAIGGGDTGQPNGTPAQVKVKYFRASSVSQKGNFTWAGQTFGDNFASDGRIQGDEDIQTVGCDQSGNICSIYVPAPGFVLVFLTDEALSESEGEEEAQTFPTTATTKMDNTATVDPAVLATSNGHHAAVDGLGSTSRGSSDATSKQSYTALSFIYYACAMTLAYFIY
ncbi:hypothetical protein IW261DRAFT_1137525 [Armillaria novae-zelandiae]|uniref:Beta-glucuronidase C-terminal domain-containing protein n=1 Tax=Armillaria novae-zelandiae TaxID=153914 RepID=A0AA39PAN4_9AGAR|nr:hypothetical protein IW261DRAFT_1137525 [Armillaria novae-zelandiae]